VSVPVWNGLRIKGRGWIALALALGAAIEFAYGFWYFAIPTLLLAFFDAAVWMKGRRTAS